MKPHIKLLIGGVILICVAIYFLSRGSNRTMEMGVKIMDLNETNQFLLERGKEKDAIITIWKDSVKSVVIYFGNELQEVKKENAGLKLENKFLKDARKKTRDSIASVKRIRVYDILPK